MQARASAVQAGDRSPSIKAHVFRRCPRRADAGHLVRSRHQLRGAAGRRQPKAERLPLLRRGFATDAAYWVFTPIVTRTMTRLATVAVVVPFALIVYGAVDPTLIQQGFGPASRLPYGVQAIAILLLGDFISYWMHRVFHGRRLWRFHAVHHSSEDLDWLSAVRAHPVNDAVMRIATTMPVLALGFAPVAVAAVVPILTLMAIVVHARLDWDWGPFRYVLASPRFHRWHHSDEPAARNSNFAGIFPVWDILFGTWYMPRDRRPSSFGAGEAVPTSLMGQLLFPFRRR
jgi:sterol desaturase/sphingolipid hydroxylase (fatty acid hydroxylase superfamily)